MKVKVKTGSGMTGLVRYQTKPGSEFVAGSQPSTSDFLRETAALRELRKDCKKPVLHFSLSQPPGETLTAAQWQQVTETFLSDMGLDGHSFFAVHHTDTDHDHIHVAVNKIGFDGKLWNTDKSALRAQAVCAELEQRFGLTQTRTLDDFRREEGHRRRVVRDGVTNEFRRTGKVKGRVQLAIQARKAKEQQHEQQNRGTHQPATSNDGRLDNVATTDHQKIRSAEQKIRAAEREYQVSALKNSSIGIPSSSPRSPSNRTQSPVLTIKENDMNLKFWKNPATTAPQAIPAPQPHEPEQNGIGAINVPTAQPRRTTPPTLNGRLSAIAKTDGTHELFWQGREKPSFSWNPATQKISALGSPSPQSIAAIFDMAKEQGIDQPFIKIYGDIEFIQAAAAEAAKRGLQVDFTGKDGELVKKYYQMERDRIATEMVNQNGISAAFKEQPEQPKPAPALDDKPSDDDADRSKSAQHMRM